MLNTNLSAQQSMPCDTFALDSLSLPRFIICPNQEKRYTKKELEQMVLLGGAYFELFEVEDAKKIFQEIIRTESSFKYSHSIADAHNYLGVIADMEEDWISAYFYFHKLLKWEKDNNVGLNVSAYLNMGALYSDLGDDGKAAQYLKKALSLSEENTVEKGWLLYHLGKLAISQKGYLKAEQHLQSANQIWELIEDEKGSCFTNTQLVRVYEVIHPFEQTITFVKDLLNQSNRLDTKCKATLLFYLGNLYLNNNQMDLALKYFRACEQITVKENYPKLQLDLYKQMTTVAFLKEETKEAAFVSEKFNQLNDSLSNNYKQYTIASLDRAKQLIEKQNEMNAFVYQEQNATARLQSQRIISIFAIGLLVLSTLLARIFYNFNRKSRKSNQTLLKLNEEIIQQKEALRLAAEKIKEQKKDLEYQLINKAFAIGQYGGTLKKLEKLVQSEQFYSQKSAILKELRQINSKKIKTDLNLQISNTNQYLFQILSEKFVGLTQSDLRLCAFLKLNLTTKEIAEITLKTPESIKVARSRLRKKLGLTHQKIAVSVFLNQLLNKDNYTAEGIS